MRIRVRVMFSSATDMFGNSDWKCSLQFFFLPAAQRLSLIEEIVGVVVGKTFFQFSLFCCENVVSMLPIGDFYVRILNYVNFWIFATIALLIRAPTYFYKHVKVPTERRVRCLISLLHNSNGKWLQPFSVVLISLITYYYIFWII